MQPNYIDVSQLYRLARIEIETEQRQEENASIC